MEFELVQIKSRNKRKVTRKEMIIGMKGYNPRKKNNFINFLKGRGFYFVLMLCIGAVGVVGYLSVQNIMSNINDDEWGKFAVSSEQNSAIIDENKTEPVLNPQEGIIDNNSKNQDKKDVSSTQNSSTKPKTIVYHMPLAGSISNQFSMDAPVFSKTMNDWRTHNGIDIKGAINQEVIASADGIIEDVYSDELKGVTIVISHNDGIITVYCGLNKDTNYKKGQTVFAGDIIGKLGSTNVFEALDEPHLHFEMIKDGIMLNPTQMLKN